ncbi:MULTISPECIES: hypothetical protein [unclassified Cryobacterium]|uniref:hypothetical protein n=1 Tax=unclassified Cryobacterium TaxID=2649013 RepID=UPI00106BED0F|nr:MULTISPECIES: hypothetical protein [unclassified Cryobacterium]TFB96544.1 hypothetical protein E3O39_10760 [Cryobacterium sp. MDB2-A-1]TFC12828.1 hypothetical protein E3O35_07920 [Cryobacterium sp. MDB2-A-2]
MSNDKMARLQNAVTELAGWSGNDIAGLIEDGLIEDGDLEAESLPTPPADAVKRDPDARDPEWIVQQRIAGWPEMHPEDFCHRCGTRNMLWAAATREVWLAGTSKWAAETGREGICCPRCFADMHADQTGHSTTWMFSPHVATPPAGEQNEEPYPGCAGDGDCPAPAHQHGCFADLVGHCNEPEAHVEAAGEPEREALAKSDLIVAATEWLDSLDRDTSAEDEVDASILEDLIKGCRREPEPREVTTVEYETATTTGPRKSWDRSIDDPPDDREGWELDPTKGRPGESWDRFDYHEERYWRRLVTPSTEQP